MRIRVIKKRKRDLEKVCEKLEEERDVLAETKTGATALALITQSNAVARTVKEKKIKIKDLEKQIEEQQSKFNKMRYDVDV